MTAQSTLDHAETGQEDSPTGETRPVNGFPKGTAAPFNRQTARLAGLKSAAKRAERRQAEQAAWDAAEREREQAASVDVHYARIRQIERLIDQNTARMLKAPARDLTRYALALDKLYKTWQLLTGFESPGTRKSKPKGRGEQVTVPLPEAASPTDQR